MVAEASDAGRGPDETLRFAVLTDGDRLVRWQARCLEELEAEDGVRLVVRLVLQEEGRAAQGRRLSPETGSAGFLYRLYRRFAIRVAGRLPVRMPPDLAAVPVIPVPRRGWERSRSLPGGEVLDEIRRRGLDFILDLTPAAPLGPILGAARLGVWSFHLGKNGQPHEDLPGFREVFQGEAVTCASLRMRVDPQGGSRVLQEGALRTKVHSCSANLEALLAECARWPALVCRRMLLGCAPGRGQVTLSEVSPLPPPLPGNWAMARYFLRTAGHLLVEMRRVFFRHGRWSLGFLQAPIHSLLTVGRQPRVELLPGGGGDEFLADPFGIVDRDRLVVLCERFDYETFTGTIQVREFLRAPDGELRLSSVASPFTVPSHASYPFLFRHEGSIHCVLETARLRQVHLYRAEPFPSTWRWVATLLDGVAALDPTLFAHAGLWWLACTDRERGAHHALSLWYAQRPAGPWHPHHGNPVKIDIRGARPAGTPFTLGDELYRPAQDCSRHYGEAVVIHRVVRLNPWEFEEEAVARVEPRTLGIQADGVHTIAAAGDLTLLDMRRFILDRRAVKRAFARELKKFPLPQSLRSLPGGRGSRRER